MRQSSQHVGHRFLATAAIATLALSARRAAAATTVYTDLAKWQAATGPTKVETFTSATPGAFVPTSATTFGPVAFSGFTLSGLTNGDPEGISTNGLNVSDDSAVPAPFAGQNFYGWGEGNGGVGPTTVITFTTPVTAFAFDWFNTDPTDSYQLTLSNGDAFNSPPFTEATTDINTGVATAVSGFFGVTSTTPITSATIATEVDGGYISDEGFDNVRTPTTAVPEPATAALLVAAGSAGLLGRRRR